MRVKTLHERDLQASMDELTRRMHEDSFYPDCIIGVATGGAELLEYMSLARATKCVVKAQRPSTGSKKTLRFQRFASLLPYTLLDRLRIIESYFLSKRPSEGKQVAVTWQTELDSDLLAGAKSILIVDDAIDTGATLSRVLEEVRNCVAIDSDVRTAVLTTTTDTPLVSPSYCIHEKLLLRFPWSMDYKSS